MAQHGTGTLQRRWRERRTEQMMQGCGQRIEVTAWVSAGPLDLLQWGVVRGVAKNAVCGPARLVRDRAFRQPKVQQDDLSFRCKLEVLRLDIPVQDRRLALMEIG